MRVFCARRQSFSPRKKHENVAVGDVFPRAFSSESDEFSLDSTDRDSLNSFSDGNRRGGIGKPNMKSPVGLRENKLRNRDAVLHALTSRFDITSFLTSKCDLF